MRTASTARLSRRKRQSTGDYETLRSVVATASYRPRWRMSVDTTSSFGGVLYIQAWVADSNPPHRPVEIGHVRPLLPPEELETVDACRAYVRKCLLEVERHENGEWLRFGGERPFYPAHNTGDIEAPYV